MSVLKNNLKKLRKLKGLNQTEFAELFGLTRANIGSYEEGRAQPKTEILVQIAEHFGLSIEAFVNKELSVNDLSHFDHSKHTQTHNTNIISIEQFNKVPYLTKQQYRKFIALGRTAQHLLLPQSFRAELALLNEEIYLSGEGGIEAGDVLLLSSSSILEIHHGFVHVVQHKKNLYLGICFVEHEDILIHGYSMDKPLHRIPIQEIKKSWKLEGILGKKNPNFETIYLRNQVKQLESQVQTLMQKRKG